ncbi:DUF1343 domain-containing protein [Marinilabiliaceae bacterium JC017]|nr:DUF1343 domain-containing protein [Marinilabiliaceae bacterium JC017]
MRKLVFITLLCGLLTGCQGGNTPKEIIKGIEKTSDYLPLLKGKNVGVLVNHTSQIHGTHLIDTLLAMQVQVKRIFAPEHGFRGNADAGEHIKSGTDPMTGLPVISLYGKNKKPSPEQLKGLDVVIFDIQDVGVRFYTYISSMHYMMEACAENGVKLIVFDRPNPNGDYVDGPVLDTTRFRSFVGMHPIPIVHGLTVGELALMINGEGWLKDGMKCDLTVMTMANYTHSTPYAIPVKPSPNLPTDLSIRLYPSLCFFEATKVSVGRGTLFPFQVIGYPDEKFGDFSFTPESIPGMSKHPLQEGKACYGVDLRTASMAHRLTLAYLLDFYEKSGKDSAFISNPRWFNLLSGTDRLLTQIQNGKTEAEIKASWSEELNAYLNLRKKYLLYSL